jgi:dsRNA-specific ribonuclease
VRIGYSSAQDAQAPLALTSLKTVCNIACIENLSAGGDFLANASKQQKRALPRARSLEQLKKFCGKAEHIQAELGQWASNYYIRTSIERLKDAEKVRKQMLFGKKDEENEFLLQTLLGVQSIEPNAAVVGSNGLGITQKCEKLINFLTKYERAQRHGIVFVEQRAAVAVLHELLSIHPRTKNIVRCGTFIGTSNSSSRRASIGDWLETSEQQDTLDSFRRQDKNLIIATSVLEEGIDISACNVVICFNKPANLKSFIQRRGRARKNESVFVLMLSSEDASLGAHGWENLERQMMKEYQKETAERLKIQEVEDVEEESDARFEVQSTGYFSPKLQFVLLSNDSRAILTFENAVAHIYHFCQTLPPQPYVLLRPSFQFREDSETTVVTATVTLPNCVDPSVRVASSRDEWRTEKMATKDAAYQAYVALYHKGLVNDNLLPLLGQEDEMGVEIETRCALEEVSETYNPWVDIARDWLIPKSHLQKKIISIARPGQTTLSIAMILPREVPSLRPYLLYWDEKTTYTLSMSDPLPDIAVDIKFLAIMRRVTSTIFRSIYSRRMVRSNDGDDFLALFLPDILEGRFEAWLHVNTGELPVSEVLDKQLQTPCGLIRHQWLHGLPHIIHELVDDNSFKVIALSKRRDFLHRGFTVKSEGTEDNQDLVPKTEILPVESSTMDKLSLDYVECALLIPSVMHHLWRHLLARNLKSSTLKDVGFVGLENIITATNASSANAATNYQQLEFIGDSILKYIVAVQLYAKHPAWPEGYLTHARNRIVANSRLSRAAIEAGLDHYIVTDPFTAKKWSPPYISDYSLSEPPKKRTMSTKVLADVVEALIGGAFLDGGIATATLCASRLLPEISSATVDQILHGAVNRWADCKSAGLNINYFENLERLLGYQFKDRRLLLEAMTHPSCQNDAETCSYQRLEFIGDAVLDMIVVSYLTENAPELSYRRMHLIKNALVNGDFLAFLCLDATVEQPITEVHSKNGSDNFKTVLGSKFVPLCRFMRHHPEITTAIDGCSERYSQMRDTIKTALKYEFCYPWVPLTSMEPDKFLSDLVESIFGAVFLDTKGNLEVCTQIAEKLGLMTCLRRFSNEDVDILHPKNRLGEAACGLTVEYIPEIQNEGESHSCTVKVGGEDIVTAWNGSSRNEVVTRAAKMALEELARRKQ